MKDVLDWVILIIKFAISLVCLYIHFHIKDIKRFIPALIFFFTCITVMVFYKLNWFNISYRLNLSVNILYVCFLVLSYYTVYIKDLNIPSLHGEITYFSQRDIRWSQKKIFFRQLLFKRLRSDGYCNDCFAKRQNRNPIFRRRVA